MTGTLPTASVLGVPCFSGEPDEAVAAVVATAQQRAGGYACLCNVHVLVSALNDDRLRRALGEAALVLPDGWPIAWLQRRNGAARATRIAGADLMTRVLDTGRACGLRHFLLGTTPETLGCIEAKLEQRYPGVAIVGALAPPFGALHEIDDLAILDRVRAAAPDVVWCAFGAPKQELWMSRNAESLSPALLIGVGAAFDFVAGTKRRAPRLMQDAGLEWLFRLVSEPRRLGGRYFRTNGEFLMRVGWRAVRGRSLA